MLNSSCFYLTEITSFFHSFSIFFTFVIKDFKLFHYNIKGQYYIRNTNYKLYINYSYKWKFGPCIINTFLLVQSNPTRRLWTVNINFNIICISLQQKQSLEWLRMYFSFLRSFGRWQHIQCQQMLLNVVMYTLLRG